MRTIFVVPIQRAVGEFDRNSRNIKFPVILSLITLNYSHQAATNKTSTANFNGGIQYKQMTANLKMGVEHEWISTGVSQITSNYNTHSQLKLRIPLNVPLSIFSKSQTSIDLHGKNRKKYLIHQIIQKRQNENRKIMIHDRTDRGNQEIINNWKINFAFGS